jgi:hypothetical protein
MLRDRVADVLVLQKKVTAENINELLSEHCPDTVIDLLSIDIDGNDYWVWKALDAVEPRVVVAEYNAAMGYRKATSVAYDPDFDRWAKHPSGLYAGASLAALTKLAHEKGYVLVGCDRHGVNAFFVKRDLAAGKLTELTPEQAYFPLQDRKLGLVTPESFSAIAHMPFVEV